MKNANIKIGVLFSAFALLLILYIIPDHIYVIEQQIISSAFFVKIIAYGLLILGVLLILLSKFTTTKDVVTNSKNENYFRIFLTASISLMYFFLMSRIGYLFPTLIAFSLYLRVFGEKNIWIIALFSLVGTGTIYYVFTSLFYVRLP